MAGMHSRWLLIPVTLLAAHAVHGQSPSGRPPSALPPLDRALPSRLERVYGSLSNGFSADRAMRVVTTMAGGWRLAGNPAYESSQQMIGGELAAAGFRVRQAAPEPLAEAPLATQWYEEYEQSTPAWEPVSAKLTIVEGNQADAAVAPGGVALDSSRPLDRVSLCINSFSTPAGGVRAPLVFVGRGVNAADYQRVGDVRGKVVLGEADAAGLFEQAVRQRGAVGVLSTAAEDYTRPDDTPDIVQWSGIRYDEAFHAFGFKISPRVAAYLKERLAAGPVELKAEIASRFLRRPARTLVAEIRGAVRPEERVVLVAHVQEPGGQRQCERLRHAARDRACARNRHRRWHHPAPGSHPHLPLGRPDRPAARGRCSTTCHRAGRRAAFGGRPSPGTAPRTDRARPRSGRGHWWHAARAQRRVRAQTARRGNRGAYRRPP
jgi:hypothetical protein